MERGDGRVEGRREEESWGRQGKKDTVMDKERDSEVERVRVEEGVEEGKDEGRGTIMIAKIHTQKVKSDSETVTEVRRIRGWEKNGGSGGGGGRGGQTGFCANSKPSPL